MRKSALCFLTSALLILSYPPFDLGWLAWFALVPWLAFLRKATPRQAFRKSFLIGLLFFGGTVWWVGFVTITGALLLAGYLSLFFGAWGCWANRLFLRCETPRRQGAVLMGLPAGWVVLEFLRSVFLSGFGWNLLAHTQWRWIGLIQIASVTGACGISFLVVLINAALYEVFFRERRVLGRITAVGVGVSCLLPALSYGTLSLLDRMPAAPSSADRSFRVAVLQGNIPQHEKWDASFGEGVWRRYEELTRQAQKEKPDLIVWPETSVPGFLEEEEVLERLAPLAKGAKAHLLLGIPSSDPAGEKVFNSAILLDPEGVLLERYDKVHLVPFGEYLPFPGALGWLRSLRPVGGFSAGKELTVFHVQQRSGKEKLDFSVLVCFEDLFPALSREFVRKGARAFFVITNDAWFGRSAASIQHLQASVFRAVESRVWVVRSANDGWSGFIDPAGRRLPFPRQVPRFHPGLAHAPIGRGEGESFYLLWGDWFVGICLVIIALFGLPWKRWISLNNNGLRN
ncbi:MAG: apolipoprotein N-acyltransferase [Candidatus Omnitrophica bacterium]|nr:apolipoprotein N-acyltransferase [Candidatus Omnitrophota bacterium]